MTANDLSFRYLEDITDGFSHARKIGSGGYGEVYKGVEKTGRELAVKKLYQIPEIDDTQFKNEFNNLTKIQHPNTVRLIGYCYEVHNRHVEYNGEYVFGKTIYRVLCFEYLQNGSLDEHLYEESRELDWCTRYKIIKGICEGLYYLHGRWKESIYHLDLKPANILLDRNMVPKIADFGLSRLFGGEQTHTTRNCIGTEYYMPPEYISRRKISNKYDIFSLGVIILQIIAGRSGYSKCVDTAPHQFIELVYKNWKDRIEATSMYNASLEEDCQQVRRCIEIALRCVEVDRQKRPTIRDIIRELKQTETNSSMSSWNQVRIAKIGQWGGIRGSFRDIEVAPYRLKTLIIGSAKFIYSIAFTYYDYNGQQHEVGPWGGHGPDIWNNHTIQLDQSEYLMEISGTINSLPKAPYGAITSLTLVTNASSYGPYGEGGGTHFKIPTRNNSSIVGFFGRVGWYVEAFGIYVNPKLDATQEDETAVAKIGPWGGNGGEEHDIEVVPRRLESVTIHSADFVNSLAFSYIDQSGHHHTTGLWGGPGGEIHEVQLAPSEFLIGFSGTTGRSTPAQVDVVTSLILITNARSYGPFGRVAGTRFQVPMRNNASIVGFFGRADLYLNAIGVYANPEQQNVEQEVGVTKIGPWGGNGGSAHDIDITVTPRHLESITIRSGTVIDSLGFTYTDHNGQENSVGPWGGTGGGVYKIELGPSEFVTEVYGTIGPFRTCSSIITSLLFVTNVGRYGPFGEGRNGTRFQVPLHSDGSIVGFFGRAGRYVDSIGFYVTPI